MTTYGYANMDDLYVNGGGIGPQRKRIRKDALENNMPINGVNLLQQSILQPNTVINLDQLQNKKIPAVCTGLQLAYQEPNFSHNVNQWSSNILAAQFSRHNEEIDRLVRAQSEQLRKVLAERQMRNYKSLLITAEKSAAKFLIQKNMELQRAASLKTELEKRLAQLELESAAFQARAISEQSKAIALHVQLQQASTVTEDAESVCVDTHT